MYALGLSFDYHDSAAALLKNGEIVFAMQEERISRIKNDSSFPINSINECLKFENLEINDIDFIVYYENALKKFDRISYFNFFRNFSFNSLKNSIKSWIDEEKFFPKNKISRILNYPINKIIETTHHQSHRDSAIFCSGFDESLIITIDGVGEYQTNSVSHYKDKKFTNLSSSNFPNSLGLFYSVVTAFLGFKINEGEYKVMGMSAYGKPVFSDFFRRVISCEKGKIILQQKYFNFSDYEKPPFTKYFTNILGEPNNKGEIITDDNINTKKSIHYANIAASAQKVTEEIMVKLVNYWRKKTNVDNICLAGGCALNSLANYKIQKLGVNLFVQPAAGDAGCALGAALGLNFLKKINIPKGNFKSSLGLSYSEDAITSALSNYPKSDFKLFKNENELVLETSNILAKGGIIGWFQGRGEWGPRALGNRSILASPIYKDMKERLNKSIKFRESFRPFAPAVMSDKAKDYFDIPEILSNNHPEKFMLSICNVKEKVKKLIPAVVHKDGTARVQMVYKNDNELFYKLLEKVGNKTGHPVLINTSFNLKGEPIVNSPLDAIKTFELSNIDFLIINNFLVKRPNYKKLKKNII